MVRQLGATGLHLEDPAAGEVGREESPAAIETQSLDIGKAGCEEGRAGDRPRGELVYRAGVGTADVEVVGRVEGETRRECTTGAR